MLGATVRPIWWRDVQIRLLLKRLRQAGCQSIELPYASVCHKTALQVWEEGFNLTLHAPTDGCFNGAFFRKNGNAVKNTHRRFLDRAQAWAFEADQTVLINFHGGQGEAGSERAEVLAVGKEFVHWLAEMMAENYPNLRGALEMLPYDPAWNRIGNNQEELLFLTDGLISDHFGLGWDFGHYEMNRRAFSFDGPLRREFLRSVNHTHIHEFHPHRGDHCPLGKSLHPVGPYIQKLLKEGYRGIYNLEIDFDQALYFGDPWDELIHSLKLLQEMVSSGHKKLEQGD